MSDEPIAPPHPTHADEIAAAFHRSNVPIGEFPFPVIDGKERDPSTPPQSGAGESVFVEERLGQGQRHAAHHQLRRELTQFHRPVPSKVLIESTIASRSGMRESATQDSLSKRDCSAS